MEQLIEKLHSICEHNKLDFSLVVTGKNVNIFENIHKDLTVSFSHQSIIKKRIEQQVEIGVWMPFNNLINCGFKVICVDGYDEYGLESGVEYVVTKVYVAFDSLVFDVVDSKTKIRISPPSGFHGFNSKRFDHYDYSKDN